MVNLILIGSKFDHQVCRLPDGNYNIGRATGNAIIIEDPIVSKSHAELLVYGNELIVRDRGSRNGTFVDGVRVEDQRGVRHGQIIRVGRVEIRAEFELSDAELSPEASLCDYRRVWNAATPLSVNLPIILTPRAAQAG